ncbi:hypothetical protein GZH47_15520 [Paenibacillus rhizovicinus]|uniref:Uncharacterized protein n=1 Tax=Paenibacillus rhizovicinus TaxID=2704463 RepID=A0A6C0P124_9BACL|nr:hypothetical protein [Paenibacillus rhizovicinus]QHW32081.1 hypothetical protein GZH47_15520 [Paenibacillus rhizovicinus]
MFGNKNTQVSEPAAPVREVPVYTVHSLPRSYEILCSVYTSRVANGTPLHVLQQLGRAGGTIPECDAVIGMLIVPAVGSVNAYGTAIRYV